MIVLTILRVIGIILLVFLLLIVFILGLLFFVPIRYYSHSYKKEDAGDYSIKFDADWILRTIRFKAVYGPDGLRMKLKILWLTLIDTDSPSTEEPEAERAETTISAQQDSDKLDDVSNTDINTTIPVTDTAQKDISNIEPEKTEVTGKTEDTETVITSTSYSQKLDTNHTTENHTEENRSSESKLSDVNISSDHNDVSRSTDNSIASTSTDNTAATHNCTTDDFGDEKEDTSHHKKSFFSKIKAKYTGISDTILRAVKKFCAARDKLTNEENIVALKLLIKNSKYLFRHYRFRVLKGQLTYGSDDPYVVGQMMSYLSFFYPVFGRQFIIDPIFDRQIFTGTIYFRGHIRLIHLIMAIIDLMKNKLIRTAVMNHFKEDTNGRQ